MVKIFHTFNIYFQYNHIHGELLKNKLNRINDNHQNTLIILVKQFTIGTRKTTKKKYRQNLLIIYGNIEDMIIEIESNHNLKWI